MRFFAPLASTLALSFALSLVGCAAQPNDEPAAESAGAIEFRAAARSGLHEGMYESPAGGLLVVEADGFTGQKAEVHTPLRLRSLSGPVDVSRGGQVTLKDPLCPVTLSVNGDKVEVLRPSDGPIDCAAEPETYTFHPVATLAGSYECNASLSVILSNVSATRADVTLLEAGRREALWGEFRTPISLLLKGGATIVFLHRDEFAFVSARGKYARCALAR